MTVEAWKNPLVSRISRSSYLCLHSCLVCFLLVSFTSDLEVQVSSVEGLSAPFLARTSASFCPIDSLDGVHEAQSVMDGDLVKISKRLLRKMIEAICDACGSPLKMVWSEAEESENIRISEIVGLVSTNFLILIEAWANPNISAS